MGDLLWEIIKILFPPLQMYDGITAGLRNICISIYTLSIRMWNAMTFQSFGYITTALQDIDPAGYSRMQDLASVLHLIAVSLVTICILYRFFKTFNESRESISFAAICKMLIVCELAAVAVVNSSAIVDSLLKMGTGLCQVVGITSTAVSVDDEIMEILTEGNPGIPTTIFIIVLFVSIVVQGANVLITICQRIIRLLLMLPFAGMSLATIVAGGKVGEVGYAYIRSVIGYCIEGAIILLIVALGNGLINAGLIRNALDGILVESDWWGFWRILISGLCQMMGCSMVAGLIKQADSLVHRIFGL